MEKYKPCLDYSIIVVAYVVFHMANPSESTIIYKEFLNHLWAEQLLRGLYNAIVLWIFRNKG